MLCLRLSLTRIESSSKIVFTFSDEVMSAKWKLETSGREIRKSDCADCLGKGEVIDSDKCVCEVCNGKGWVRGSNSDPVLCEQCSGDGFVNHSKRCPYCKGEGYTVAIIEIKTFKKPCRTCNGLGRVQTRCPNSNCRVCRGGGWIYDQKYPGDDRGPFKDYIPPLECGEPWSGRVRCTCVFKIKACTDCSGSGQRTKVEEREVNPFRP